MAMTLHLNGTTRRTIETVTLIDDHGTVLATAKWPTDIANAMYRATHVGTEEDIVRAGDKLRAWAETWYDALPESLFV